MTLLARIELIIDIYFATVRIYVFLHGKLPVQTATQNKKATKWADKIVIIWHNIRGEVKDWQKF